MDDSSAAFSLELVVPKAVNESQLQSDIDEIWKEGLDSDSWLQGLVKQEGISAAQAPFKTNGGKQGADAATVAILVILATGAANLAVRVANDIWERFLLPKLERRYGKGKVRKR